jgi:crossover junction endodeoxyribonuclease RuvC
LKLGHARAAAMLAASLEGLPVAEYAPTLVKQSVTGKGSAEKQQVATMVRMLLPGSRAVADAADALAVAICHAHMSQTRARMALGA